MIPFYKLGILVGIINVRFNPKTNDHGGKLYKIC